MHEGHGTVAAKQGRYKAGVRHGMCELAFSVPEADVFGTGTVR